MSAFSSTPSIFKTELENNNSFYLVALYNNEIVGFAGYLRILDEADITNIVVRKDMRNKKIATKLFENLLNCIKKENINAVTLEVNENNIHAIHLYSNFGFEKVGLRKNYYKNHENALLMKKLI